MTLPLFFTYFGIILGVLGIGFLLLGIYSLSVGKDAVRDRLTHYIEPPQGDTLHLSSHRRDQFSRFRYDLNKALSVFASEKLQLQLLRADWPITVIEFILIRMVVTGLVFAGGWFFTGSLLVALGLALIAYITPGTMLVVSIANRQRKFQDQLIDTLVLIRGAVQAGYSFLQSLDVVVSELPAPASEEFDRVKREIQLGLPMGQALLNLSTRMESDDLHMVVTAVIINNQVGGNLSTMLTAVTDTIRARIQLFGEVRALTSYARYTSTFLTLLPLITALIIYFINPTYFDKALISPITQTIFFVAGINVILGNIWLRRIARVRV